MIKYILIMLSGILIASIAQILLKSSALSEHSGRLREYLNVRVILAYSMMFASTLLGIKAYRVIPLSMGAILEASGYVYITLAGRFIFHEKITLRKVISIVLIISGIIIYSVMG